MKYERLATLTVLWIAGPILAQPCAEWEDRSDLFMLPALNPSATYDSGRDRVVSLSLVDRSLYTSEWNGSSWDVLDFGWPPGPRLPELVYDSWRGVSVAFGGGYEWQDDTWEWDGFQWSLSPAFGPEARNEHAMAFDSLRGVVVLHAGYADHDNRRLSDTWEYDGSEWRLVDASGFGARTSHAMAFDESRGVTVAFGGTDANGRAQADTWEWDGTAWARVAQAGPPPTWYHKLVYDPTREACLLVGGLRNNGDDDNIWAWDGSQWTEIDAPGPGALRGHAAARHGGTDRVVVFGGFKNETSLWEVSLIDPPLISEHPVDREVNAGESVSFSVVAESQPQPSFQWYLSGNPLVDDGRISGSTTADLTIADAGWVDEGEYSVVVSNGCGEVQSESAALTVVCAADFNDDRLVDTLDVLLYLNAWSSGSQSADFNGDGTVNTLDFLAYLNAWVAGC